jgi:predicted Rdx family selenoprotein
MALAAETLFNIYVNGSLVWERKNFREAMRRLPGRVKVEPAKRDYIRGCCYD